MKNTIVVLSMMMLIGCSHPTDHSSRHPSEIHSYSLTHAIDHSLQQQECLDRFQECLADTCNHWQEACDVEPVYCQLDNWGRACHSSCQRKIKVCLAR